MMKRLSNDIIKNWFAILVLLVFVVVHLLKAEEKSFWIDELYSVYYRGSYHESFFDFLNFMKVANPLIPVYEVLLYIWTSIFGDSEISARSLSIILVAFSGIVLHTLCKKTANIRVANTALILFLFSSLASNHALNARYYGVMLLLTISSSYFFYMSIQAMLKSSDKIVRFNKPLMLMAMINSFAILNHIFNYIFIAAQLISFLIILFLISKPIAFIKSSVKVTFLYLFTFIIALIIWPPLFGYYTDSVIQDFGNIDNYLDINDITTKGTLFLLITLAVTITAAVLFRRIKALDKIKSIVSPFHPFRLAIISIFLLIIVILFRTDLNVLGFYPADGIKIPYKVLTGFVIWKILNYPSIISLIALISLALYLLYRTFYVLTSKTKSSKNISKLAFIYYVLLIIILSCILISLLGSVQDRNTIRDRHVVFLFPLFIFTLALAFDKILSSIYFLIKKHISPVFAKYFVKYSFVYSILLSVILTIPMGFMSYIDKPRAWRQLSMDIVDLVNRDSNHKYYLVETAHYDFPIMNYYLGKHDDNLTIDCVFTSFDQAKIKKDDKYVPEFLDQNSTLYIENHDYLVVIFIHPSRIRFIPILNYLNKLYTISNSNVDNSMGYYIYDLKAN